MARPKSITRASPYTPTRGRLAGRTFTSQRSYEDALAKVRGFASSAARQRRPVAAQSRASLAKLSPTQAATRQRALEAISRMRRDGMSLARAAKESATTPGAVRRYAGSALQQRAGVTVARPVDRLTRVMQAITTVGVRDVAPANSQTASTIAAHANAVREYLNTGHTGQLRSFRGSTFRVEKRGFMLETNPRRLDELADAGELDMSSIYATAA